MGFTSCKAGPDVWMRPGTKDDGSEYWEFVLLFTDNILAIMCDPEIGTRFTLIKESSIGPPTQYLGNKVSNVTLANGLTAWTFSSSQYTQSAVKNVKESLAKEGKKLPTHV